MVINYREGKGGGMSMFDSKDPNKRDSDGFTLLFNAINFHMIDEAKKLLAAGARVNDTVIHNKTPLYEAVRLDYLEGVRLLVEYGADPNIPAVDGTPLDIAKSHNNPEILSLLTDYVKNPDKYKSPKEKSKSISNSEPTPQNPSVEITITGADIRQRKEAYPIEETYREEVVVRPKRLFRKAITEIQTKTRTVMKTKIVKEPVIGGSVQMEFIYIPPGTFTMGQKVLSHPGNLTAHEVTLTKGFYLGKYPVTQAQWQAIMGENPSHYKGQNLPVEYISWNDCQEFINKINQSGGEFNFRLPTEAEWEYACRAGSTTEYHFGDEEDLLGEYAWYWGNSGDQYTTKPVGKKKPNAWGLFDMIGNVNEWCHDYFLFEDYPHSPVTDPTGPKSGPQRILRGGCHNMVAKGCCSANRISKEPDVKDSGAGFRLAYHLKT